MSLSIFAAKILALFYLSVGVGVLNGQMNAKKMLKSFKASPGLTFISGFFMIIIGALLVQYHNIWVKDWTVLITIVGWAILIKGILFIAFPKSFLAYSLQHARTEQWLGYLVIAIGLLFGYFGFVA